MSAAVSGRDDTRRTDTGHGASAKPKWRGGTSTAPGAPSTSTNTFAAMGRGRRRPVAVPGRRRQPGLVAATLRGRCVSATASARRANVDPIADSPRGGRTAHKARAAPKLTSVRPKTGDFAVVRCRRRVFSRRILRRVGIFSEKSSPSRAEKAASRDVGGHRATPKRPTSRVGYQNRIRPRLRGHQTSSTASTRLANQTLSFSTLQ